VALDDGTRLGELDEVFVFESRIGDRFMLGAFAWQIERVDRDRVYVRPAPTSGAVSPFWQGDWMGRKYSLGRRIGADYAFLEQFSKPGELETALQEEFAMEPYAAMNTARLLLEQREANGFLPTDSRIVIEHFRDDQGTFSAIVYTPFGGRVILGLLMLLEQIAAAEGRVVQFMQSEDGILLHSMDNAPIPEGLLHRLPSQGIADLLRNLVPHNPLFAMVFRYNASRSLMMGMRSRGRVPLWLQRLRSDETLQRAFNYPDHPLLEETMRDCLSNYLDLQGINEVLAEIHSGQISVLEVRHERPSPMAIEFQRLFEGMMMYEDPYPERSRSLYQPTTTPQNASALPPVKEDLDKASFTQEPSDCEGVHNLLMISGDLRVGDLDLAPALLNQLAEEGRARYIEPGLWIATEEALTYEGAFSGNHEAMQRIVRRCLRYRGAADAEGIAERYALDPESAQIILDNLVELNLAVPWEDMYVHRDVYERASGMRRARMRAQIVTAPPHRYAAWLAQQTVVSPDPQNDLEKTITNLHGYWFPRERWEETILPARVLRYQPRMLDTFLQNGSYRWRLDNEKNLRFDPRLGSDIDAAYKEVLGLSKEEEIVLDSLRQRGALFASALLPLVDREYLPEVLLSLMQRGLISNDSLKPARILERRASEGKARVRERLTILEAGRWEALPELVEQDWEERLRKAMGRWGVLCRETAKEEEIPWGQALETLRLWEYTGQVRRGYFVRGLSGAQFIANETAPQMIAELATERENYICLAACDPAQAYGNILLHLQDASFISLPSTAIILRGGRIALILERHGANLRFFDAQPLAALQSFVSAFRDGRIWSGRTRIVVKKPDPQTSDVLLGAGFTRSMLDYILYRNP
ncbi:MAG: DEAD/DEAH box helicase, partial [Symbiobacteriaceae bacterium]|nr:DEAD/DEAH box helicase [Symbiobacteriaceae bacterium]